MTTHDYSQCIAAIIERYGVACSSSEALLSWCLRKETLRRGAGTDDVAGCFRALLDRGAYWDCESWEFDRNGYVAAEPVSVPTFRNRAVIIVEPHPDDAVLTFGGLIRTFVADGQDVYVLTGVSGWHSVADDLVARLPEGRAEAASRRYQALLSRYDVAVPVMCDTDMTTAMIKGGIRLGDESSGAFQRIVSSAGTGRITAVPLLLPFYDLPQVYPDAQSEALNVARACAGIREVVRRSGACSLALFCDSGQDPRGTHQTVNRYVCTACDQLVRDTEVPGYVLGAGCGPWVTQVRAAAGPGMMIVPMDRSMMQCKIEAFLAHRSQLVPAIGGDDSLPFHERALIQNRRNAVVTGCARPYAEAIQWM